MTEPTNRREQAREQFQDAQDQARQQFNAGQDLASAALGAWNEVMAIGSDAAFDVALRNWNYSKSARDAADRALEETLARQRELTAEMLKVWEGYANTMSERLNRSGR